MKAWMVPVVVTVLAVGLLLFVMPINADASYSCRSAAATLVDRGREPGAPPGFFDDVTTCNRNAPRRGLEAGSGAHRRQRRDRARHQPPFSPTERTGLSSGDRPGRTITR